MSTSDGQKANQTTFNNAYVSRTQDSNTVGKVDLENVDAASGASITNAQRSINGSHSFVGSAVNGTHDQVPTWASDAIGVSNEDVQARIEAIQVVLEGIQDGLDFQGVWDANANTPTLVSSTGTKGHFYIVDTAGSTSLDGITDWLVGDWAVFDGTVWRQVDNTDAVSSVNSQTGAVVLDIDDVTPTTTKGDIIVEDGSNAIRVAVGSDGQVLTADSGETSGVKWDVAGGGGSKDSMQVQNAGLANSVAASAMTINLKQSDGSTDPSTGDASVDIPFRSSTLSSGAFNVREVTSALSIVIPSGANLIHTSGNDGFIFVYGIDNAGTVELAVSSELKDESQLHTTIAITAGADDSFLYSTTLRSNVPIKLLGKLVSNQVTAGTWALVAIESSVDQDCARLHFPRIAYVKDVKATNTDGGTFTAGLQTRQLNTVEGDSEFVSIASDQFTLRSGTYDIQGFASARLVNGHTARIQNITDASLAIIGSHEFAGTTSDNPSGNSFISGQIVITSTKTFELQHQGAATRATDGFGLGSNFGTDNVYAQLKITKLR